MQKIPLVRAKLADGGAIVGVKVHQDRLQEVRYVLSALHELRSKGNKDCSMNLGKWDLKISGGDSCWVFCNFLKYSDKCCEWCLFTSKSNGCFSGFSCGGRLQETNELDVRKLSAQLEAFLRTQPNQSAPWSGWAGAHQALVSDGLLSEGASGMLLAQEAFEDLDRNGKIDISEGLVQLRAKPKGSGWYIPPPKKPKQRARGRGRGRG